MKRIPWVAAALVAVWSGCGAPGEPMPPLLKIPERTTDLTVAQHAGELVLRWTVPSQTTEGFPLKELAGVAIVGLEVANGQPDAGAVDSAGRELARLNSLEAGQEVEKRLALPVSAGQRIALGIKNYNHRGRAAGISNVVVVEIAPVLPAPAALTATSLANAIRLEWPRVPGAWGYHVYKKAGDQSQFALLAPIEMSAFNDTGFTWDISYQYLVRAFAAVSTGVAEGADSPVATIVPKDIFPPSTPAGLRAVPTESSVELSWSLSPEPDTAGYNVYRRDAAGRNARLNSGLLTAPVFSDKDVRREQQYSYAVTAVDDKGNESAPSAPLQVTIP